MFRQLISIAVLLQVSQEVAGNLLRRKLPEGGRLLSIEDFGGAFFYQTKQNGEGRI